MDLTLADVTLITINPGESVSVTLGSTTIWKIESAGVGGTKGTIFLQIPPTPPDTDNESIAMLYSSVNEHNYGSPLPFWIPASFSGFIFNDSTYIASVSVSVYSTVIP